MEKLNIFHQGVCDTFSIWQGLPHILWDGESADGGTSFLATRLIHNKPVILSTSFLRCYFLTLDPYFLMQLTSFAVVVFLIAGFFIVPKSRRIFYMPLFFMPLLFIFPIPVSLGFKFTIYRFYLYILTLVAIIYSISILLQIKRQHRYKHE